VVQAPDRVDEVERRVSKRNGGGRTLHDPLVFGDSEHGKPVPHHLHRTRRDIEPVVLRATPRDLLP